MTEEKRRDDAPPVRRASAWAKGPYGRAAKIAGWYLIAGSAWIILSDTFAWGSAAGAESIFQLSMFKGLLFVFSSAALIFALSSGTLKRVMESQKTILKMNREMDESSRMYKGLYEHHKNREALMEGLVDSIPDLIFHKDTSFRFMGCNRAFSRYVGRSEADIVGRTDGDFLPEEQARMFLESDEECLRLNATRRFEHVVTSGNGEKRHFETIKTPYRDDEGNVIGLIGISRDVTERKEEEQRILYLSTHDAATGLNNRLFLLEEMQRLDAPENLPLAILMGDINGLKLINDSLGHDRGDLVILATVDILKSCLPEGAVLARTGGDEFTALIPRTDAAAAQKIIESILAESEARAEGMEELYFASLCLGAAIKREPDEPVAAVRKAAEDAMYRRKIFEQRSLHSSVLTSMKKTMLEKSDETEAHAERLAALSHRLGRVMNLPDEDLVALELLSTLHDIGKISVDKDILTKVGTLTDEEWLEIKKHPEVGFRIALASPELAHIAEYILSHHERWDGRGYPRGIAGAEIPLLARILAVVDSFDAMTQDRSYRRAMPVEAALQEIRRNAGTQFDPDIAEVFLSLIESPAR